MLNYEEEVAKFSPSTEVDRATEIVYDNIGPDITDILEELLASSEKSNGTSANKR